MKKLSANNKILLSGNEAIGRGAIEAGISLATSYPGTPATEILEYLAEHASCKVEWAINEKVALETAIGASYAGKRALVSMKHVGLNVASDALVTCAYLGVYGGLVIVVADDPGAYSSQNEQDSRFYAQFAKIPCLEPADAQEAKDMVKMAFGLSEKFKLPVIVRSVTRISHTAMPVSIEEARQENPLKVTKDPASMIAVPSHILRLHKILNEKQPQIIKWGEKSGLNKILNKGKKKGIIASGLGADYAREYGREYSLLKISFYPFPEKIIRQFVKGQKEVWVLEEGEPYVEAIARSYSDKVKGKLSGDIAREGELGPDIFKKLRAAKSKAVLPKRPPVMCQGCPHRELYLALKAAEPAFTTGDIGCYTLGAAPPLSAIDTCLCMGAGLSQAAGISNQGVKKVAAVIGDSTFLHAGIPALISAVYNQANMLVLILDNSSVAMTGHQPTPLTGITARGRPGGKVSLEEICKACGVNSVEVIDPFKKEETAALIKEKINSPGVNVIISRRPCILAYRKLRRYNL